MLQLALEVIVGVGKQGRVHHVVGALKIVRKRYVNGGERTTGDNENFSDFT